MVLKVSMYHNALKIIFIDLRTKVFAMKIFLRTVAKKFFLRIVWMILILEPFDLKIFLLTSEYFPSHARSPVLRIP